MTASASLTRHFVRHFLDTGFESVDGADGVRRVMLGVLSAVLAIGLFLPRLMSAKYHAVAMFPELYRQAVLGDTLMTLALAMLAVAFAAALAGDSMFPDETDFRVLTPLPITRGFVFAAKLRAVALYLGIVTVVISLGLQLPFTAVSGGPYAVNPWVIRAAAHALVGTIASVFAALAVLSVHGAIVLGAPARCLRMMSVGARTTMLCAVVVLLPLAARLPHQSRRFTAESALLYALPPAWFAGLEQVLLGSADRYSSAMAVLAIASSIAVAAIVSFCYLLLYRRFDVVVLRASRPPVVNARGTSGRSLSRARDPQTTVVQRFASTTLWRSPLHQVVFLGVTACGVGWVINGLLGAGVVVWARGGVPPPRLLPAMVTMPFVLILAGVTGLRGALLLPQDSRANWIFRMGDRDDHRPGQLDAVECLFIRLVIAPVLACTLPLEWAVVGAAHALVVSALALGSGMLLVELVISNWRRIPFTCSYIPGKRQVAETVLLALMTYVFFTGFGRALFAFSRAHPSRFLIALGFLLTAVAAVRRYRLNSWGHAPLMFDDDPPEMAQPIRLS